MPIMFKPPKRFDFSAFLTQQKLKNKNRHVGDCGYFCTKTEGLPPYRSSKRNEIGNAKNQSKKVSKCTHTHTLFVSCIVPGSHLQISTSFTSCIKLYNQEVASYLTFLEIYLHSGVHTSTLHRNKF